jgi:hypothetical protein
MEDCGSEMAMLFLFLMMMMPPTTTTEISDKRLPLPYFTTQWIESFGQANAFKLSVTELTAQQT